VAEALGYGWKRVGVAEALGYGWKRVGVAEALGKGWKRVGAAGTLAHLSSLAYFGGRAATKVTSRRWVKPRDL
jgi:hypothetical protein